MKRQLAAAALIIAASAGAAAFSLGDSTGMALHGSIQADVLFPEADPAIGIESVSDKMLFNTYADLNFISRYVDAGARLEFMKWPLPGYEKDFKGWGVPHIYAKGRFKGFEVTAGDFYEQFGSGFILRTYEERALGIDNAIRGGRLRVTALPWMRVTALGGLQRRYWDWKKSSQVYGGEAEVALDLLCPALAARSIGWNVSAAYVLRHEDDEEILIPGTDYRLNLPKAVSAVDFRTQLRKGNFGALGEFAWKGQDPSFDNGYTYGHGTAAMLSLTYSRSGFSALAQTKRSENMAFRSQRAMSGTSAMLNNMPAFAYLHTYALPALYPYATQAAKGEWAFQGSVGYSFKRKTLLGGKYGTKVKLNASYIRGLHTTPAAPGMAGSTMGTDGPSSTFFGMGPEYYHDVNLQVEKKWSKSVSQTFMYMNQLYNKSVIEGKGGTVATNIFVVDTKWKINPRYTLRNELQYLHTRDDQKDWLYGLLELSVAPHLMATVSDMWNVGDTRTHYYSAGLAANLGPHRISGAYGRTRAGFNCSGGVCRQVPATRGFQLSYAYTF